MADIFGLLKHVIESKHRENVLPTYLRSCAEQLAFSKGQGGLSSLIGIINSKLNETSSRYEGFILLQSFLPQCNYDLLNENAVFWMTQCLKGTNRSSTSTLAYSVLKALFQATAKIPELTKQVASSVVPKLAEQIHSGVPPQNLRSCLECLEICMEKYNGSCGPHKRIIEDFLFSLIDYSGSQQQAVVRQAGHCVALLPQIGGGGTGGALYRCAWANQHLSLLCTLHHLLDELLVDTEELRTFLPGSSVQAHEPLSLPSLEKTDIVLFTQSLACRISIVSMYLEGMLVRAFPVPKKISVDAILALICRGLAITPSALKQTTTHTLALKVVLPGIHLSLLRLLDCLIAALRTNLYPHSGLIIKQIFQVLKWTHIGKAAYGTEKPYRALRHRAYGLLSRWCNIAKCGSRVEDVADQLIEMAISDFKSERDTVILLGSKNRKQTKRKRGAVEGIVPGQVQVKDALVNSSANKEVCVAALQAMRAMLASASSMIKPTAHKILQEAVLSILLDVNSGNNSPVIPYSAAEPRLELYSLLLGLVLDSHPVWPSPCNMALQMFAAGQNDSDRQVSELCTMAIACVEKIIHPAFGSMRFQVPAEDLCSVSTVQNCGSESSMLPKGSDNSEAVHSPRSSDCGSGGGGDEENKEEEDEEEDSSDGIEEQFIKLMSSRNNSLNRDTLRRSLDANIVARMNLTRKLSLDSAKESDEKTQGALNTSVDIFDKCASGAHVVGKSMNFPPSGNKNEISIDGRKKYFQKVMGTLKQDEKKPHASQREMSDQEEHSNDDMIDLAESNSDKNFSEGEIEEVPVEIDLADSDEGNQKVSATSTNLNYTIQQNGNAVKLAESDHSCRYKILGPCEKPIIKPIEPSIDSRSVELSVSLTNEVVNSNSSAKAHTNGQHKPVTEPESDQLQPEKRTPPKISSTSKLPTEKDCSPKKPHALSEESLSPSKLKPVLEDIGEEDRSSPKKAKPALEDVEQPSAKKARVDEGNDGSEVNGSDDGDDSFDESEMLSSFVDMIVDEAL